MNNAQFHRLAELFPMMNEAEFSALLNSMNRNGYDKDSPIVNYEGKILDGRNRWNAAQETGVKPTFTEYHGDDPLGFVIQHNLTRRHLNETQRAGVAAKIANMEVGDNQYGSPNLETHKVSVPQAAEMLNVGKSTVATYRAVAAAAPELVEKMDSGEMTAHQAEKKVKEKKRKAARAEMAENGRKIKPSDYWNVWQADIQTWNAPRQYDFIITDPPYPKEFLPLYSILAKCAAEWLKPGGLLIAMCGQSYLDEIINEICNHLEYYWMGAYLTPKIPTPLRQKQVNTTWKPLLMFVRPSDEYKGKTFNDVFISDPESMKTDKNYHDWGQSISGMSSIIEMMCYPGQYILDPFCGSGTTGISAMRHNCFFDGIDIDEENVKISKARLNDITKT